MHCIEDHKVRMLILFHLWTLVFMCSIFNGKGMQLELFTQSSKFLLAWIQQIEPQKRMRIILDSTCLLQAGHVAKSMFLSITLITFRISLFFFLTTLTNFFFFPS